MALGLHFAAGLLSPASTDWSEMPQRVIAKICIGLGVSVWARIDELNFLFQQ
jgi:hypothetical protein